MGAAFKYEWVVKRVFFLLSNVNVAVKQYRMKAHNLQIQVSKLERPEPQATVISFSKISGLILMVIPSHELDIITARVTKV